MTDWTGVASALLLVVSVYGYLTLLQYLFARGRAYRLMKILLHRAARSSKRALEFEDRMTRKCRNRIRLLK